VCLDHYDDDDGDNCDEDAGDDDATMTVLCVCCRQRSYKLC